MISLTLILLLIIVICSLNVQASFVVPTKNFHPFKEKYQRNNKKGGQKNLRCFPHCRNGRHVSSGFCGDSIKVHVAVTRVTESGGKS